MVIQVSYANEQPAFGCHAVLTDSIVDEQHTVKLPAATSMASQGVVRKKIKHPGSDFFSKASGGLTSAGTIFYIWKSPDRSETASVCWDVLKFLTSKIFSTTFMAGLTYMAYSTRDTPL